MCSRHSSITPVLAITPWWCRFANHFFRVQTPPSIAPPNMINIRWKCERRIGLSIFLFSLEKSFGDKESRILNFQDHVE